MHCSVTSLRELRVLGGLKYVGCPSAGVECVVEQVAPAQDRRCLAGSSSNDHFLHRKRHHRPRRARARPQAPGHVHRRRRLRRPPPPRLGDPRQLDRRGDERPRLDDPGDAARGRRLADHRGRRPRHPRGQAPADQEERPRGDLHDAARGRQVRPRATTRPRAACTASARAWSTRCRRSWSPRSGATAASWEQRFKQGKPVGADQEAGRGARDRHDHLLPPRPDDLPEDRVRALCHPRAARDRPATCTRG